MLQWELCWPTGTAFLGSAKRLLSLGCRHKGAAASLQLCLCFHAAPLYNPQHGQMGSSGGMEELVNVKGQQAESPMAECRRGQPQNATTFGGGTETAMSIVDRSINIPR